MEDFNKVISFVLGLIVVVVALVVITRKYDFTKKLIPFSSNATITATPTPTGKVISEVTIKGQSGSSYQVNKYQDQRVNSGKTPATIPATGAPTFLLPVYALSFLAGLKLRKKK